MSDTAILIREEKETHTDMLHPIDIVTRNNQPTTRVSDPEEANNIGLWHRGVHVALYTDDGRVLIQKRSANIIYHPGVIEIGVGGYVDSGETPEQAAVREVKEETGLTINPHKLQQFGLNFYNNRWKYGRKQKISRTILYSYVCRVDDANATLTPQLSEVEWVRFEPLRSVQWLVHRHHLKRLGILSPQYAYYRKLLATLAGRLINC